MGKLLDAIKAQRPDNSVATRLKRELSKEDYADLITAMKDHTISGAVIAGTLNGRGLKVGISSINAMRKTL